MDNKVVAVIIGPQLEVEEEIMLRMGTTVDRALGIVGEVLRLLYYMENVVQFCSRFKLFTLGQLDVILGNNWLSTNHVLINCTDNNVLCIEPMEVKDSRFITPNKVEVSLKDVDLVYMLLVSLKVYSKASVEDLLVVSDFSGSISKGHL